MKKLFITIAFVAATMFASAQFYFGGSLGMATQSGKWKSEAAGLTVSQDQPKSFDFTFAPQAGFMFTDNMGVGAEILLGMGKTTDKDYTDPDAVVTTTLKSTTFGFAPYFRFVFASIDNFRFYADARLAFSTSTSKGSAEVLGTKVEVTGPKRTNFGFGIEPGLAYMITDNISMNCSLNLLELGFRSSKVVRETTDTDIDDDGNIVTINVKNTTTTNNFGFGVNNPSAITIGFFYTF